MKSSLRHPLPISFMSTTINENTFIAAIDHLVCGVDLSVNTLAFFVSFAAHSVPNKSSELQMFSK